MHTHTWTRTPWLRIALLTAVAVLIATEAFAQTGFPLQRSLAVLLATLTGPFARGIVSLATIVLGVLFLFGSHEAPHRAGYVALGGGFVIFSQAVVDWLFV